MRIVGPSSEDEMVLAFLKAEIDSSEYPGSIERVLSIQGNTRVIIASVMASGIGLSGLGTEDEIAVAVRDRLKSS